MIAKVVKPNEANELFINTYVVVGQRYYYIDTNTSHVLLYHRNGEQASLANLKLTIGSSLACSRLTGCHSF